MLVGIDISSLLDAFVIATIGRMSDYANGFCLDEEFVKSVNLMPDSDEQFRLHDVYSKYRSRAMVEKYLHHYGKSYVELTGELLNTDTLSGLFSKRLGFGDDAYLFKTKGCEDEFKKRVNASLDAYMKDRLDRQLGLASSKFLLTGVSTLCYNPKRQVKRKGGGRHARKARPKKKVRIVHHR